MRIRMEGGETDGLSITGVDIPNRVEFDIWVRQVTTAANILWPPKKREPKKGRRNNFSEILQKGV